MAKAKARAQRAKSVGASIHHGDTACPSEAREKTERGIEGERERGRGVDSSRGGSASGKRRLQEEGYRSRQYFSTVGPASGTIVT